MRSRTAASDAAGMVETQVMWFAFAGLVGLVATIERADAGGAARRLLDRVLGRTEQLLVGHKLARQAAAH